ncbi:histone deacetylase family protein [Frateuria aurantia]
MLQLYSAPACLRHDPGIHPESPARLHAVLRALDAPEFAAVERILAPAASREQLLRVHQPDYIDRVLQPVPPDQTVMLAEDTVLSEGSALAALHAAGAVCSAVDAVLLGSAKRAFCAVRPPGHHAMPGSAMGFCLFNNIAVGAAHALAEYGLKRIAIVDFDVHHGNGSQHMFQHDPRVMFASSQESPLFPYTGGETLDGNDHVINGSLLAGDGSAAFRQLWQEALLPRLFRFKPQLVLVSAGFDGYRGDPTAHLQLGVEDFAWITGRLVDLACSHAGGRLVSSLEGGYDLEGLACCSQAHLRELRR